MKSIIITGCDSGYFGLAQSLVRSLRRFPALAHITLGFLDFGLDDAQRAWLAAQNVEVKPGGWDMDFPGREVWETTRPWFKIYLCRPHLRQHFPGYDVYCWLDADTWVQLPQAVEQLLAAAARGGLAASPEVDRSYVKFISRPGVWQLEADIATQCLGEELGGRLRLAPSFNAGVFAMRHDAPHWEMWRHYMMLGLNRVDPQDDNSRMVEQVSFNAAVYLHAFPTHRFPSTYNWLACLALPYWDVSTNQFVEPAPPHAPIAIMHLSLYVLQKKLLISALYQGESKCSIGTGLTFDDQQLLVQSQARILSEMQPAAMPTEETDYVSPELARVAPDACFPHMVVGDKAACPWPHLRREVPHRWYIDRRHPGIGFLSRDEAHLIYNTALRFRGRRALEVGCWMGWSTCHLALAGVKLDVIDPMLNEPLVHDSVRDSLRAANVLDSVRLIGGTSPAAVRELATREQRKWSLLFVDGDHEGEAPLRDVIECEQHAEQDAAILFHDLTSPDVAAGIRYLRDRGWKTRLYHTMQIVGIAWRGNVVPVDHVPDPTVKWVVPEHLRDFNFSRYASAAVPRATPLCRELAQLCRPLANAPQPATGMMREQKALAAIDVDFELAVPGYEILNGGQRAGPR